jgi:NTP pyrophosphatase (non-canonical NTP hydrolase)
MDNKTLELLELVKEESGELVVAASKCTRWGLNSVWQGRSNLQNLTQEAADVMCLIQLLVDAGVIDGVELATAQVSKIEKLKKWSSIFKNEA